MDELFPILTWDNEEVAVALDKRPFSISLAVREQVLYASPHPLPRHFLLPDALEVLQADVGYFDAVPSVDFQQFLTGGHHLLERNGPVLVQKVHRFAETVPGEGVVCDGIDVLHVSLVSASYEVDEIVVVDVWVQDHVVPADHVVVGILRQHLVGLGEIVLEVEAAFVDGDCVRMVSLIERHQVVSAGEAFSIEFVQSRNVSVELPAEPE